MELKKERMQKAFFKATAGTAVLAALLAGGLYIFAWLSQRSQPNISPQPGMLITGKYDANWVSTTAPDDHRRHMDPIPVDENPIEDVVAVLESEGMHIVTATDTYVHAVDVSDLFRFHDDVEFKYDSEAGLLHYRSASRVGSRDFEANVKRMNALIPKLNR